MNDEALYFKALAYMDQGNTAALRNILQQHPHLVHLACPSKEEPYRGYFYGATLLHHVAGNPIREHFPSNVTEIAQTLLEAGAKVDAPCGGGPTQPTTGGGTTLGLVASGSVPHARGIAQELIDLLVKAGANVKSVENGGILWMSLYHTVEYQGQREVARMVYDHGAPVDMCYAAGLGLVDIVESYFDDPTGLPTPEADYLYRQHRKTAATPEQILQDAFLFACINNELEVVRFLQSKDAEINAFRPWASFQVTPLHGACWAGWVELAEYLMSQGADLALRDPEHDGTPVSWARHCNREAVVLHFNQNYAERLSLDDALESGDASILAKALGKGDPNQPVGKGDAGVLLRLAAYLGNHEMVTTLLKLGADPHLANRDGQNALFYAEQQNHPQIIQVLKSAM